MDYLGAYSVTFLVKDNEQADALKAEVKDIVRKENLMHPDEWKVEFWEQPVSHLVSIFHSFVGKEFDVWATVRYFLLVLLVLLLVPALNLSGMIASRMENRLAEMGVRKSFGAGRRALLSQVMWENLLLTLAGGILGLVLAWVIMYTMRESGCLTYSTSGRTVCRREWTLRFRARCCLLRWYSWLCCYSVLYSILCPPLYLPGIRCASLS